MVNNLKKIHLKFPLMLLSVAMCSLLFFAFESNKRNKPSRYRTDAQMVSIPGGAFYMGASDEQVDMALMNRKKLVSIQSFWMDRTEITNAQYRKFVNYVADSLKFMALYGGGINATEDSINVDWNKVAKINIKSKAVLEKLNEILLSPDNRFHGKIDIDPTKLIYKYSFVDLKAAAVASKGLELPLANFIVTQTQPVYPDTLVWMRDFSYSYNEPLTRLYFSHPSYNDYPVVGVTWKQANAFCYWRTDNNEYYQGRPGKRDQKIDGIYRLPTEAEWEYAARGNSKINAMFPWGSPYARTREGRLMANFKPGRGDYYGGDTKYDNVQTTKIKSFTENGFGLYDMSGNVAEWTSSVYYEGSTNFMGDFNPDVQYNAKDGDPILMKRKVIRGGSWKDIAYNCQVSTRAYEYQDTAKSFIGFRCVLSTAPRPNY
jgi:sulfatase modifying factor 1